MLGPCAALGAMVAMPAHESNSRKAPESFGSVATNVAEGTLMVPVTSVPTYTVAGEIAIGPTGPGGAVGTAVGDAVGVLVGAPVGVPVGLEVGAPVGGDVGFADGPVLGAGVGLPITAVVVPATEPVVKRAVHDALVTAAVSV